MPPASRALAAYKDFLTLWKDADPDIPILKKPKRSTRSCSRTCSQLLIPLRANIRETPVVPLINEQGEKEKGRDEWHFSWCSFLGGFGWR